MASVERQRRLLGHLQPAPASAVVEADVEAAARDLIGLPVEALDTPSLYVDLDAVESNIGVMSEQIRSTGAVWRPHTKAIRSPALAQMLVDGGAVGVTCAKITQAAALVAAGIKDVLIANEIVGPIKVANLVELSKSCDRLTVAVDNADNLRAISAEAVTQDAQMSVLVDLNIGMNRCGIHWSKQDEIVMMAQLATDLPNIEFMGLMGYDGHAQGNTDQRISMTNDSSERLGAAKGWVEAAGIEVRLLSGAGSGNYWEAVKGSTNEIQAGGGVLFCMQYKDSHNVDEQRDRFQHAIKMQIQIVSVAGEDEGRVVGDAGFKTMFPQGGRLPHVVSHDGLSVASLSAEHTIFQLDNPELKMQLGERVTVIPPYSDASMILHRNVYAVRDGVVVDVWEMDGSIGRTQ